jgi:two-component system chemotaxis sensor kinase CheA
MDVVKTNIQKLNGSVEIRSEPGKGSVFIISLPLTLAILPVLLVLLGEQPFALPLSMVREILPIDHQRMQEVGGKETLVVRGEILPVIALSRLLGWPQLQTPEYGVLMQTAERSFILAVDNFAGRDDAVIKALDDFRPRGVAGVTTLSNGQIVLILDMKELLGSGLDSDAMPAAAIRGRLIFGVSLRPDAVQGAAGPLIVLVSLRQRCSAQLFEKSSKLQIIPRLF